MKKRKVNYLIFLLDNTLVQFIMCIIYSCSYLRKSTRCAKVVCIIILSQTRYRTSNNLLVNIVQCYSLRDQHSQAQSAFFSVLMIVPNSNLHFSTNFWAATSSLLIDFLKMLVHFLLIPRAIYFLLFPSPADSGCCGFLHHSLRRTRENHLLFGFSFPSTSSVI